jgi:trans-aconitate 2-methyltransferase
VEGEAVKALAPVMDRVTAYRLWQAPFAERKLEPVLRHNRIAEMRRVLDVGCGPGTNARHFQDADYLGVDMNPDYIAYARRRWGDRFAVEDVTRMGTPPGGGFDAILVNSLLHHIDDANSRRILAHLARLLTEEGHVHILDLVLPTHPSLSRWIARSDRGDYPRPLAAWREMFEESFETVLFEPYPLGLAGVTLWNMVYFKGRRRP